MRRRIVLGASIPLAAGPPPNLPRCAGEEQKAALESYALTCSAA
jgi:hypothetical protein